MGQLMRKRVMIQTNGLLLRRVAELESRINDTRHLLDAIEGAVDSWLGMSDGSGFLSIPRSAVYEATQKMIKVQDVLAGTGNLISNVPDGTMTAPADVVEKYAKANRTEDQRYSSGPMARMLGVPSEFPESVGHASEYPRTGAHWEGYQ